MNATLAPMFSRTRRILFATAVLSMLGACKGSPEKVDSTAAKADSTPSDDFGTAAMDTSVNTILGVAANRTPGAPGWCLLTSRRDIGTTRPVKVVFMTQRKIAAAKVGEALPGCPGEAVKGAKAWNLIFTQAVPTDGFPAIVLRDDMWGNIGRNLYADFDLNGDQLRDTITVCTNGTVARFQMKWAGDVQRNGWRYEHPYTEIQDPLCADMPVQAVSPMDAVMIPQSAVIGPTVELPYDRQWLVLRRRDNEQNPGSDLLKTTVLPMKAGSCTARPGDGRRLIASASPNNYIALLANLPGLKEGPVPEAQREHFGDMLFSDSARLTMNGRTMVVRNETAGATGFRLIAQSGAVSTSIFEAAETTYPRWNVAWAGDLDGDGEIDLVTTAHARNWQTAMHVLLSRQRTALEWPDAAFYVQKPC